MRFPARYGRNRYVQVLLRATFTRGSEARGIAQDEPPATTGVTTAGRACKRKLMDPVSGRPIYDRYCRPCRILTSLAGLVTQPRTSTRPFLPRPVDSPSGRSVLKVYLMTLVRHGRTGAGTQLEQRSHYRAPNRNRHPHPCPPAHNSAV